MREIGEFLSIIGIVLFLVSYLWSFIIGYRTSAGWLIGLLIAWIFAYPALVINHWQRTQVNFYVVVAGVVTLAVSFVILMETNPNRMT